MSWCNSKILKKKQKKKNNNKKKKKKKKKKKPAWICIWSLLTRQESYEKTVRYWFVQNVSLETQDKPARFQEISCFLCIFLNIISTVLTGVE